MGVIYYLVNLDARERYDLDKWGNRGLSEVFGYEEFTLAVRFGTVWHLADALVSQCRTPNHEEHLRDVVAPDVWDWAGPDARIEQTTDMHDNDEQWPDYYSMPVTGSRMGAEQEGLAIARALLRWHKTASPYEQRVVEKILERAGIASPLPGKGL